METCGRSPTFSRAREECCAVRPPHTGLVAGSPLKRARNRPALFVPAMSHLTSPSGIDKSRKRDQRRILDDLGHQLGTRPSTDGLGYGEIPDRAGYSSKIRE